MRRLALAWVRVAPGDAAYDGLNGLPPLVTEAVGLARREGFGNSCRPEHGRLLFALASVEVERDRAALAAELFNGLPQVTIIQGDWPEIQREAPFDLLVLDGGGHGKEGGEPPDPDPAMLLRPGGMLVIDDLTPASTWPPMFQGQADAARMYWLTHPDLDVAELRLAPDLAALVATRRWPPN